MNVVDCCGKICPDASKALIYWRPRRDLNPCYRRESEMTGGNLQKTRGTEGTQNRARARTEQIIGP